MVPPPTRLISFLQEVRSADPNFQQGLIRPWIYQFSNGRLFYRDPNVYALPAGFLKDDAGNFIYDEQGNPLQSQDGSPSLTDEAGNPLSDEQNNPLVSGP